MPFDIGAIGQTAAQGVLGQAMGLALEHHNDQRQLRQQNALQQMQIQGQEQLTDYNYTKQMQLWHDTNYGAQIGELQKAGLNPGLLYAKGGTGGQTAIQQGSVSGGRADQNPGEIQQAMGLTLQAQMIQAQTQLAKAEANKANADADATRGYKATESATQTQLNIANTGNAQADTQLKQVEAQIQQIAIQLQKTTVEQAGQMILSNIEKNEAQIQQIAHATKLTDAQTNDILTKTEAQYINILLQNALTKAETNKTQAEITKMATDSAQKWQEIQIGWKNAGTENARVAAQNDTATFLANLKAEHPGLGEVMGKTLETVTDGIIRLTTGHGWITPKK